MAMENSMHRGAFIELLSTLCHDGEICDGDITKGFQRVASKLDDTVLDNPSAREQFAEVLDASRAEEPLTPNLLVIDWLTMAKLQILITASDCQLGSY